MVDSPLRQSCPHGAPQRAHARAALFTIATLFVLSGCSSADDSVDADPDEDSAAADNSDAGAEGALGRGRPAPGDDALLTNIFASDAGTTDDAKGPPGLVTLKQACEMRAERHCSRLQECSDFFLRMVFGKPEVCKARLTTECVGEGSAADVAMSTYTLVRCAQDLFEQSCADIIDRREPDSCRPLGLRRESKGCASDLQCATGFCSTEGRSCGTCKAKVGTGESCARDSACVAGLHCGSIGRCVRKGVMGDPCGAENQECGTLLSCLQGKCAVPLAAGAACLSTDQCLRDLGHVCSTNLGARPLSEPVSMCRASVLAAPGDICRVNDNLSAYCASGPGNCVKDNGGVYRCVQAAQDGEACGDKAGGRACMLPATCVAGFCRLGSAASCMP